MLYYKIHYEALKIMCYSETGKSFFQIFMKHISNQSLMKYFVTNRNLIIDSILSSRFTSFTRILNYPPVNPERNLEWGRGIGDFLRFGHQVLVAVLVTLQVLATLWSRNAVRNCICGEKLGSHGLPAPPIPKQVKFYQIYFNSKKNLQL